MMRGPAPIPLLLPGLMLWPQIAAAHAPGSTDFTDGILVGGGLYAAFMVFLFAKTRLAYLLGGFIVLVAIVLTVAVIVQSQTARSAPPDVPSVETTPEVRP